ncbi:glycosyltransferase family 2 protein [Oleomonas cavernae]|nr:glycosyltransferase family 2 protein [Oleomonas cavernae]
MIAEIIAWAGGALGLISAVVTLVTAHVMCRRVPALVEPVTARAVMIVPATGDLPRLAAFHDALLAQRCRPARIVFAVESVDDPAYARLLALVASSPFSIDVVVAGEATASSQKCRNQASALRLFGQSEPYVVLADIDILPPPDWLGHLLRPLTRDVADVVTGYRWTMPADARPATVLGTWIDRSVAGLPKPNDGWLAWGGSIALRRDAVERLGLPDLFEREISDDLSLAKAARRAGARVIFRRSVLLPTPVAHSFASLIAFGQRQYQMFLFYQWPLWLAAAVTVVANLFGSVALLWLAFHSPAGLAAYALSLIMIAAADQRRRSMARRAGIAPVGGVVEVILRFMPLLLPVIHLLHLAAIVLSLDRRKVVWGHCVYRMRGGRVTGIERRRWSSIVSSDARGD